MKKTLTVNLGGTVFHIDEDAYQLLDKYLSNLRIHFRHEEGSEEIMGDFEMRISELLNEKMRLGYNVVTIEHVEEVIKRMGRPEEIFGESQAHAEEYTQEEQKAKVEVGGYSKKRLFRNPDDSILGGVAGGFAAYMGWDSTAIRIGLILLMFFYGVTIPVYLVLWLIVPKAQTAAEKLQMRGESVTIENIGKTVTDGFENISNNINDYVHSGKPRNTLQKLGDVFVTIFGAIIKVLAILFSIILFPPLLIVLFVLFVILIVLIASVIGGGFGVLYYLMPYYSWDSLSVYPDGWLIVSSISCILMLGIPLIGLIYAVCGQLFKWRPMASGAKWVLVVLWIVSLIAVIAIAVNYGFPVWNNFNGWHWNTSLPISQIKFW